MPRSPRGFSHWRVQLSPFSPPSISDSNAQFFLLNCPMRHKCQSITWRLKEKWALRSKLEQLRIKTQAFGFWIMLLSGHKDVLKNNNTKDKVIMESVWRVASCCDSLRGRSQEGLYLANQEIELWNGVTQWKALRWRFEAAGVKPVWRAATSPKAFLIKLVDKSVNACVCALKRIWSDRIVVSCLRALSRALRVGIENK